MVSIDLNCDLGEGRTDTAGAGDELLMPLISSANIACGFHASNPLLMEKTVVLAKRYGVAVGAHPSYPDHHSFGRRDMDIHAEELRADLIYQVGALAALCRSAEVPLRHVKVHGALYNRAAVDGETARTVAAAIRDIAPEAIMVCLAGSQMSAAARELGMRFVEEAYADRAYAADGTLVPRTREGAVLLDSRQVAERLVRMIREKCVAAVDGSLVPLVFQTVCVHGDTPGGVAMIREIRHRLAEEGILVAPCAG
ncbi:MAG: LamB/YcsF family protein [Geobacteraceae bacterium]|nr:LamB/YcsF family protein [Geobacteraceae bacterium]